MTALIQWNPPLNILFSFFLLFSISIYLYFLFYRIQSRFSGIKAIFIFLPRFLLFLLFIFALFDPVYVREIQKENTQKMLFLLDTSSSMEIQDDLASSRVARAREIIKKAQQEFPSLAGSTIWEFNTHLNKDLNHLEIRGTDIGGCLGSLALKPDISSYTGIVMISDGGDEEIQETALPSIPLYILGMGTDPASWNDIGIFDFASPSSAEQESYFEIHLELIAYCKDKKKFQKQLQSVKVNLQIWEKGWETIASKSVNLSRQKSKVFFKTLAGKEAKREKYRIFVENIPGELTYLNNERIFYVEIQKKSLHILYFSRELGSDFKILRGEFIRDPGVTFTSLVRISSERFLLQGHRLSGDEVLSAGFPKKREILQMYDCIILGSFPSEDWDEKQQQALLSYVEEGGSVIFLGGESSFGLGKYASTSLAPLFPWQISNSEEKLLHGTFPVFLGLGSHAILDGLGDVSKSILKTLNDPGPLRHAALSLLNASTEKGKIPAIAIQPFGKGQTLGIATNMLWVWARVSEESRTLYAKFWRQAIRYLSKPSEGGQLLSIEWDKNSYSPGEKAFPIIQTRSKIQNSILLTASLSRDKVEQNIPISPKKEKNFYNAELFFPERGEYFFRIVAYHQESILETYQKAFFIAPLLPEGSRPEMKEKFLSSLASKSQGFFMPEAQAYIFFNKLKDCFAPVQVIHELSLAKGNYSFFLLFLLLMAGEWLLYRIYGKI